MTLISIQKKLRTYNRKNYYLFFFCNTIALMLITAYSSMLFSPTVLTVLPPGGDSRKQMTAIFVLTCVGCIVFILYSASLFFRVKAKEIGVFMALGASQKKLRPLVIEETIIVSGASTIFGTLLGIPFSFTIWQLFRIFLVDTEEMKLRYDYRCLYVSALFILLAIVTSAILGLLYLKKTNLMDVIHEEHKNEPVPRVKRWYGGVGIILLFLGGFCGYFSATVYISLFSAYPPAWLNLIYLPMLIGLYMILFHTIIHGWGKKKHPYKNLISRSMMKFQGKQTVNNMLIVTVLIAGACFASFYLPTLSSAQQVSFQNREYDYAWHYRSDQPLPDRTEIEALALDYGVKPTDWNEGEYLMLGVDGEVSVEDGNNRFHKEYRALSGQGNFLSTSAFYSLTGIKTDIPSGTYYTVTNNEETAPLYFNTECTKLTNMSTRQTLPVTFGGLVHYNLMSQWGNFYVISDADYAHISDGLTPDWKGYITQFNAKSTDSYAFSTKLYNLLVDSFTEDCAYTIVYDPVSQIVFEETNDSSGINVSKESGKVDYKNRNLSDFRTYWNYMPSFRIMDEQDSLKSTAVFMMMFLFIAIICLTASILICYIRGITIALNNRYVFEDLLRLGASPSFIKKELKNQSASIFSVPSIVGISMMYLLYCMIMYGNDGRLTSSELIGLFLCFLILLIFAGLIYSAYRFTLRKMQTLLNIR